MDRQQRLQEEQYRFPYHYIPQFDEDSFSPVRYWAWSHHYLGGFEIVFRLLASVEAQSIIDIGCGDGRFLAEAASRYPDRELRGVDYSERAIRLARALNPGLTYDAIDIVREGVQQQYDVATMIEVLEHIPPAELDAFLGAVAATIAPGGSLILTVPHANKSLQAKHYQHFTGERLRSLLSPHFETVDLVPFDRASWLLRTLHGLLGGRGRHIVVTERRALKAFWKLYKKRFLLTDEAHCLRIAALCRRPLTQTDAH